uniref:Uncharacterized protein n=1 Tax=Gopherus agassizii TaxID=38772 RepID=A0A452J1T0_9SAUR
MACREGAEVQHISLVKLCSREFIRTVIASCGGSWGKFYSWRTGQEPGNVPRPAPSGEATIPDSTSAAESNPLATGLVPQPAKLGRRKVSLQEPWRDQSGSMGWKPSEQPSAANPGPFAALPRACVWLIPGALLETGSWVCQSHRQAPCVSRHPLLWGRGPCPEFSPCSFTAWAASGTLRSS